MEPHNFVCRDDLLRNWECIYTSSWKLLRSLQIAVVDDSSSRWAIIYELISIIYEIKINTNIKEIFLRFHLSEINLTQFISKSSVMLFLKIKYTKCVFLSLTELLLRKAAKWKQHCSNWNQSQDALSIHGFVFETFEYYEIPEYKSFPYYLFTVFFLIENLYSTLNFIAYCTVCYSAISRKKNPTNFDVDDSFF